MLPPPDRAVYVFRDTLFAKSETAQCFWCDTSVDRHTSYVDHLISRLKNGRSKPDNMQIVCRPCGRDRLDISYLAARLRHLYQNGGKVSIGKRRLVVASLLRKRDGMLDKLLDWETYYHERLQAPEHAKALRVCLNEIDEILRAKVI